LLALTMQCEARCDWTQTLRTAPTTATSINTLAANAISGDGLRTGNLLSSQHSRSIDDRGHIDGPGRAIRNDIRQKTGI
jgi:hypothetical protein